MTQQKKQSLKQANNLYGQQDEYSKEQIKNQTQYKNDKKKRKKKRMKPRHSPEYYEELRRLKQNRKKQSEWDSRFNLAVIPDLFEKSVKNIKPKIKLRSLRGDESAKRGDITYKTFNAENQNKSKPAKSFNIRVVSKKQQTEQATIPRKQSIRQQKPEQPLQKPAQKPVQKPAQKLQQTLTHLVESAYTQLNFYECHKSLMLETIKNSKQKEKEKLLKNFIYAEVQRLKQKTSTCSALQLSINKREEIGKELQIAANPTEEQVKRYRLSTLRVIQVLLKWRDEWQKNYYECTKIKTKVEFVLDGANYLAKIYRGIQVGAKAKEEQDKGDSENNPFLLGFFKGESIDNELIVRIRACEMLLLQNELEVGDKE